ncbi:MAG: hypothetical protein OHK0029_38860 [Armatimonadaceae bacterium]
MLHSKLTHRLQGLSVFIALAALGAAVSSVSAPCAAPVEQVQEAPVNAPEVLSARNIAQSEDKGSESRSTKRAL